MRKFFNRQNAPLLAYLSFWTLFFLSFWSRAFFINDEGGLTANHFNVWGDWAIHFTMGSAMAFRELFLTQNPLLIDSVFRYPFFVNQLSAILIKLGVPFIASFTVPSFFFSVGFTIAVWAFFRAVLGARRPAFFASFIFLLSGGLGFLKYIKDVAASDAPWVTLFFPPHKYTQIDDWSIFWINVIDSMVIPQRAFQFGFPCALAVMAAVFWARGRRMPMASSAAPEPGRAGWKKPLLLGMALGFQPIVHFHAFAGAFSILGVWGLYDVLRFREGRGAALRWWLTFYAGAGALSAAMFFIFFAGAQSVSTIRWFPGWQAESQNWALFWLLNWGLMTPMAILGLSIESGREPTKFPWASVAHVAPYIIIFAAANLLQFHPWIWDNSKILVWASLGFSGFAALAVEQLLNVVGPMRWLGRTLGVLALVVMTASGAIDMYRTQLPIDRAQMYSNEELYLADWTRKNTAVDSVWITGNYHNQWMFNLTGRQAVVTYNGWLWTHGYDYYEVEADVMRMFKNPARVDLFRKYRVTYAVVGPYERGEFKADEEGFASRYAIEAQTDHYRIYNVTKPAKAAPAAPPAPPASLDAVLPLSASLKPGLIRRTYADRYFFGEPVVKEGDVELDFRYDSGQPRPFPRRCSIEWEGFLRATFDGEYRFSLASDDGAHLYIDDALIIDDGGVHMVGETVQKVKLSEGYHRFRLKYYDLGGGAVLRLGWSTTPGARPKIEEDSLYH